MMKMSNKARARSVACVVVAMVAVAPASVSAQAAPTVAYDGVLRTVGADGVVSYVDGPTSMRFALYSADRDEVVWAEEWSDDETRSCSALEDCTVDVDLGAFSVALGRFEDSLAEVVATGEELYLRVAYRHAESWVQLDGQQRLTPAWASQVAQTATDLWVEGDLTVSGGAELDGAFDVPGTMTVSGQADLGAEIVALTTEADSVTVTGGATAGSMSTISGVTSVSGLSMPSSAGGDFSVFDHDGSTLTLGDAGGDTVRFAASSTISGDLVCGDDCGGDSVYLGDSSDDASLGTHWFYVDFIDMGQSNSVRTDIRTNTWECWVGGVRFQGGDPDVGGTSGYYAYVNNHDNSTYWTVRADFSTDGTEENRQVMVVCSRFSITLLTTSVNGWYR